MVAAEVHLPAASQRRRLMMPDRRGPLHTGVYGIRGGPVLYLRILADCASL